jgi:hypothetical protein
MAGIQALAVVPIGATEVAAGSMVRVLWVGADLQQE